MCYCMCVWFKDQLGKTLNKILSNFLKMRLWKLIQDLKHYKEKLCLNRDLSH